MARGDAGEQAAELHFPRWGWRMFRTQPATKTVRINGKKTVVPCGKGGIVDYTGYSIATGQYRAAEVKEAERGKCTLKHSRLSDEQRDWMALLPDGAAWVVVLWSDGTVTRHRYKDGRGAYEKY